MFLLKWYREWMEIRVETKMRNLEVNPDICKSCDVYRTQLDIVNYEKKQLIDRLLEKPAAIIEPTRNETPVQLPRNIPWHVRRQMLEAEDREKARLMKAAAQPDVVNKIETEELEKALDLAAAEREKQSS